MVTSSSAPQRQPYTLPAATLARAHTILAALAFSSALFIGSYLHYYKIVKNGVAAYPDEWFPSVSATIGDWYPERNIFQILIALTAGPRFALVLLQYYLHRTPTSSLPTVVFITGIIRTLSCGGWVYITSSDDHDVHDVMMILYMVCNIPWMLGGIASTPVKSTRVRRKRTYIATAFFTTIVPLVYYFIQHKVHRIPGAYTRYAFFEWGLIFFDVFYDSVTEQEFRESNLQLTLGPSLSSTTTTDQIVNMNIIAMSDNKTSADILKVATNKALMNATNGDLAPATVLPTNEEVDWTGLRQPLSFISDVYLSYLFFTLFTSLIPTLFYFSVWELGIAGQELFLFTTLSPFLLGIPTLYRFAKTRNGQVLFHLLSFVGLGAYVLEKPLDRLFVVGGANVLAVLRQAAEWSSAEVGYQAVVASLGFMVSSLSKHANHSNNPLWPFITAKTGGYNKTGLALGVLAVLELYFRHSPSQLPSTKTSTSTPTTPSSRPSWLTASLPLGSLLFSLHNLLSEPSTLIAWSWTGYENGRPRGPVPHIHGSLTLVFQSLGLLLPIILSSSSPSSSTYKSLSFNPLASPLWFIYGSASAYAMYTYRNWPGYAGGLAHAMFLMSITPLVFQRAAAAGKVARTYGVAFLVYCLFNLASIFTAAYAFVPGGQYFRERTDLVTIAQLACLSLAFRWPALSPFTLPPTPTLPRSSASHAKYLLSLISILAVLTSMYRAPSTPPTPFKSGPRIVNAGIWTIHFGIDNEGHDSQRGVRNLIRDMELDIVGLLETDLHRTAFGHRDLTRVIIEDMGYNVDIGPGPNSHTWGCVLLTKFPIINTTHHLLPSPHGELAPAIEAVLDIYGTEVTVVVSHNGQEEDPLDRELQSIKLAQIMSEAYPRPVIFLGYVVTKPHTNRPNPYEIMVTDGRVFDIEINDFDRWCEYIFFRGLYRTAYVRISRGIITDTEMQIGQFVVPKHGANITDDSVASYFRVSEGEMPKEHVFPYQYYGNDWGGGVDKHYYHVFGEPLYYKIPENAVL